MWPAENYNGNSKAIGKYARADELQASARTEEIQSQFQFLSSRDLQLWSISLLVIVVLGRRALDQMLDKEVARSNHTGSALTVLMLDIDNFTSINTRVGQSAGDRLLSEAARLLKNTFRGSDMVFRYGGDEFLVVMPDTTEQQAERAVARLLTEVDRWNAENRSPEELALSCGLASYVTGARIADVLATVSRRMLMKKNKLVPVF